LKCQFCGAENFRSHGPCRICGKPLGIAGAGFKPRDSSGLKQAAPSTYDARPAAGNERLTTEEIARGMRMEYTQWSKDSTQKVMDVIQELLATARSDRLDMGDLLEKTAKMVHQQFRLRWVALGTRSEMDGLYRYNAFAGLREDAVKARQHETFKREDFDGTGKYPGRLISRQTMLFLEEDKPYTEGAESTFNRPALMNSLRHSHNDCLEADYMDIHIFGRKDDLLGWIEVSGTLAGKLPDVNAIRWIEIIASILGVTLRRRQGKI
jgi:hypothetical protein